MQQSEQAGGKVHFLLGNHEVMVLKNDLRYVHENYLKSAELMGLSYADLFNGNSLLGKWIQQLPVAVMINGNLILHAGISPEIMNTFNDLNQVNATARELLLEKCSNEEHCELLAGSFGPFWYRGYFQSHKKYDQLLNDGFTSILENFQAERMIVGHTTFDNISILFDNRLFNVDAGIKYGVKGKMLSWKQGSFYVADETGKKELILSE